MKGRKILAGIFIFSGILCASGDLLGSGRRDPGVQEREKVRGRRAGDRYKSGDFSDRYWDRIDEELELTDEQRRELETRRDSLRKRRLEIRKSSAGIMKKLREELDSEDPDPSRIEALIEEAGENYKETLRARVESLESFRDILTDGQWERARKMRMRRRDK